MANEEMKATLDALHLLGVDPATGANQLRVLSPRAGVVLDIGASQGENVQIAGRAATTLHGRRLEHGLGGGPGI